MAFMLELLRLNLIPLELMITITTEVFSFLIQNLELSV